MKKLLGILGTITISGSGMAGLVGNVPAKIKENNNLQNLIRVKRGIFDDILSGVKTVGRKAVEMDRDVRQAVQNKAIEVLESGKLGPAGEIGSAGAKKVKELWDSYDAWKLRVLS